MSLLSPVLRPLAFPIWAAMFWSCSPVYTFEVTRSDRDRVDTLQSGGINRTYEVRVPLDYETSLSPVVILIHGEGGDGFDMKVLTSFDVFADEYGFVVVYPNASSDWAYGCGCTDAEASGVDDVEFLTDLIDELDSDYGINRDSVFVGGNAEGALMAQKLACDATSLLAGLATVGATMPVPLAENCAPEREIPIVMIQGTEDLDFPWDGAPDRGLQSLLSVDTTVQFWASNNGCGDRGQSTLYSRDAYYNFDVYRDTFEDCPANGKVILYRMEGAGDGWPNAQFSASDELARFFVGDCCGSTTAAVSSVGQEQPNQ